MSTSRPTNLNPTDILVDSPPPDSTSSLEFSPASITEKVFLAAGSWDADQNVPNVRLWDIDRGSGKTVPLACQSMEGSVLDISWSSDGTKICMCGTSCKANLWDLNSNQVIQIAQHEKPIKTCHYIDSPKYTCVMTSSWDKTIKFWDLRTPTPMLTFQLPDTPYCADVCYPMAVVGTSGQNWIIYSLENTPREHETRGSSIKAQSRCVAIFKNKDAQPQPTGFAFGTSEGRAAVQYLNASDPNKFIFRCHQRDCGAGIKDIYAVNDIKFHPTHGTLATVGSDGKYYFWDKNKKAKIKMSDAKAQSITSCAFNSDGQIFAYAVGYDWSKGYTHNTNQKNEIFLNACIQDAKPKTT